MLDLRHSGTRRNEVSIAIIVDLFENIRVSGLWILSGFSFFKDMFGVETRSEYLLDEVNRECPLCV